MLVSAERLHRFKCAFCGSKDKNIVNFKMPYDQDNSCRHDAFKIVTCNQCGYTMIFSHSAAMAATIIANSAAMAPNIIANTKITIKESEEFVKRFHEINHVDVKANPHFGGNDYHDKPPLDNKDDAR